MTLFKKSLGDRLAPPAAAPPPVAGAGGTAADAIFQAAVAVAVAVFNRRLELRWRKATRLQPGCSFFSQVVWQPLCARAPPVQTLRGQWHWRWHWAVRVARCALRSQLRLPEVATAHAARRTMKDARCTRESCTLKLAVPPASSANAGRPSSARLVAMK